MGQRQKGTSPTPTWQSGNLLKKLSGDLPFFHIKEALGFALAVYSESKLPFNNLSSFKLPSELLHTKIISFNDIKILDDSYNSSLESIEYAMKSLLKLKAKRHLILLSDTHETHNAEEYHENIGKAVAAFSPDLILLYGKYTHSVKSGALKNGYPKEKIIILTDSFCESLVARLTLPLLSPFDALLIKGSHGTNAYKIAPLLTK